MLERTLVTLDGTERSRRIVPYALELATKLKSKVILLRVVEANRWDAEAREAEQDLARIGELFIDGGSSVETDVRVGRPQEEILKAALEHRVDLILMATRSPRGLQRVASGSVAEYVLRESQLPVMLVRAA